jgi:hypothetical protein
LNLGGDLNAKTVYRNIADTTNYSSINVGFSNAKDLWTIR